MVALPTLLVPSEHGRNRLKVKSAPGNGEHAAESIAVEKLKMGGVLCPSVALPHSRRQPQHRAVGVCVSQLA